MYYKIEKYKLLEVLLLSALKRSFYNNKQDFNLY